MKQTYYINDRFEVKEDLNLIIDKQSGAETRLEPRVMRVLSMLAATPEAVVAREDLAKKIWDDYGGADEAITQSISFLRKVLNDTEKEIIRTVPKKGYLLQGFVGEKDLQQARSVQPSHPKQRRRLLPVFILIPVLATALLLIFSNRKQKDSADTRSPTEIPFPAQDSTVAKDPLNSISTTDSNGTRYRLVMIGDRAPQFYRNDSVVENQEPYASLIDQLARELWKRREKK